MGTNEKRKRANFKQAVFLLLVLLAGIGGLFLYYDAKNEIRFITARFKLVDGTFTPPLKLELAISDSERGKGLMWRKPGSLPPDQGMLFIFPEVSDHLFWMENTYLALDMIFISPESKVVGILENVQPLTREQRKVGVPNQFVVELLAGRARQLGIDKGAELVAEGALPTK